MRRGDIALSDERAAQHVTRDALVDLLPQRREDTFRRLRMFFEPETSEEPQKNLISGRSLRAAS